MKRTRAAAKIQQQNTIEENNEETIPKIQTTSMVCVIFYNFYNKRVKTIYIYMLM